MRTARMIALNLIGGGNLRYRYVDATGGVDTNDGLTPATAWKTVGKVNGATLAPGTRILFKCGETFSAQLTIPANGITIGAYGTGAKPMFTGSGVRDHAIYASGKSNITIDGIQATATVWETVCLENGANVEIKNCIIVLGGNNGIYLNAVNGFDIHHNTVLESNGNGIGLVGSTNGEIRNNDVTACGKTTDDRSGISLFTGCENVRVHHNHSHHHANAGGVGIRGIILDTVGDLVNYCYGNEVNHCDGSGIYIYLANNQQVFYNIVHDCTDAATKWPSGIYWQSGAGGGCYNNTCYMNKEADIRTLNYSGLTLKNNIMYSTRNENLETGGTGATSHTADYNLMFGRTNPYRWNSVSYATAAAFYAATGQGQHDQKVDPLFVNAGSLNFHLQALSPARGAGVGVGLTADYDGVAVPATPDVGAYQYV